MAVGVAIKSKEVCEWRNKFINKKEPDSEGGSQCGSTKSRQERRGPPRLRRCQRGEEAQCEEAQRQIEEIVRALAAAQIAHSDSEVGEAPYARLRIVEKEVRPESTTKGAAVTSSPRIKTNRFDGLPEAS
ncbi:hypothetical protein EOD39_4495 [Acipenser ruthenus]|uniref:Uncharacterized protein n=1 Tax=Acipenser ruthenus TaxID=7906 RepID=A0A444UHZ8_ACIRT|nr:hypothetical protein EOD39_4495 [Acipenser ruthenus]